MPISSRLSERTLEELGVEDRGVLVGVFVEDPAFFFAREARVGEAKLARDTRGSGDVVARGVTGLVGREILDRKLVVEVLDRKLALEVVDRKLALEVVDCMLSRLEVLDRGVMACEMLVRGVLGCEMLDRGVLGIGEVFARGVLGRGM